MIRDWPLLKPDGSPDKLKKPTRDLEGGLPHRGAQGCPGQVLPGIPTPFLNLIIKMC